MAIYFWNFSRSTHLYSTGNTMKPCFSLFLIIVCTAYMSLSAQNYLGITYQKTNSENISVVEIIDKNQFLVNINERGLLELQKRNTPVTVCDTISRDKFFFMVFPEETPRSEIEKESTILHTFPEYYLVAVPSEKDIMSLASLPVELHRVFTDSPVAIKESGSVPTYNTSPSSVIDEIVAQVSIDSMRANLEKLTSIHSRCWMAPENKAEAVPWIQKRFTELGADSVFVHTYPVADAPNVIAIKKGKGDPSLSTFAVCGGHFDCLPGSGRAPGADDNGSGLVATLEALRILKNYDLKYTVKFEAYNAEEIGQPGSQALAMEAQDQNHTVVGGMVNFDMIGHTLNQEKKLLVRYTLAVPGCKEFARGLYKDMIDKYTGIEIEWAEITGTPESSDHASYWKYGYMAVHGRELNKCSGMHGPTDIIGESGVNDFEFMKEVVQAGLATVATLAEPMSTSKNNESSFPNIRKCITIQLTNSVKFNLSVADFTSDDISLGLYSLSGRLLEKTLLIKRSENSYTCSFKSFNSSEQELAPGCYVVGVKKGKNILQSNKVIYKKQF